MICREEDGCGTGRFLDIGERHVQPSEAGDPLEKLNALVPREVSANRFAKSLQRSDGAKGGQAAFGSGADVQDHGSAGSLRPVGRPDGIPGLGSAVVHAFARAGLGDRVPDAETIWFFREQLTKRPSSSRWVNLGWWRRPFSLGER